MNIFLTGATGFLGGELLVMLAKRPEVEKIYCLVRASNQDFAQRRLEKVFRLHNDPYDPTRVIAVNGTIGEDGLCEQLKANTQLNDVDVIIHSAANTSFARIYDHVVEKVNVHGLKDIASWAADLPRLQLFTYVGTATIIGKSVSNRTIHEEESPNLKSRHFVKYTHTKMVGEMLLREFLPAEKLLVVRPSIILGDTRPHVPRSYVIMWALAAGNLLRLVPVNQFSALDIVPIDFAAGAIVNLLFAKRRHNVYHISSGEASSTNALLLTESIADLFPDRPPFKFVERGMIHQMKLWARGKLQDGSELCRYDTYLKYWDEVFDDKSELRILFAGLEPYLEFIELGQLYDNSRLLHDANMAAPEPAHSYLLRTGHYLKNIDVMQGAIDP